MGTSLHLRMIHEEEVANLQPLYEALAAHHNRVSIYERGRYPTMPIEKQLSECRDDLACGKTQVAIVEHADELIAFCKIDIVHNRGYIDDLCVLPSWRGRGIGTKLLNWALGVFTDSSIAEIELMVVEGNDEAMRLYERQGFKPVTRIMRRRLSA